MTAKEAAKKAGADSSYGGDEAPEAGKGSPAVSPGDLERKQKALLELQAKEKELSVEIAALRALKTDVATFESQIKANGDAIEKEKKELQTFSANELKALDAKTRAAIASVIKDVDAAVAKARSDVDEAAARTKSSADALQKAIAEAAAAEADYNRKKQAVAEVKRILGELKAAKREVQAAQGRNEFAVAGYWLLEMERRLTDAELPDTAAVTSAWEELGRKRKAADDATREAEAAKAGEAARRKARDEAEKNREPRILERLKAEPEAQKPETAA
jgi:hypothetical protein